jgi:hypothetical protein
MVYSKLISNVTDYNEFKQQSLIDEAPVETHSTMDDYQLKDGAKYEELKKSRDSLF